MRDVSGNHLGKKACQPVWLRLQAQDPLQRNSATARHSNALKE